MYDMTILNYLHVAVQQERKRLRTEIDGLDHAQFTAHDVHTNHRGRFTRFTHKLGGQLITMGQALQARQARTLAERNSVHMEGSTR